MRYYLLTYTRKRQYWLLAGDVILLLTSLSISYMMRVTLKHDALRLDLVLSQFSPLLSMVVFIHILTIYLLDQYSLNQLINRLRSAILLILSSLLAGVVVSALLFFFPKNIFGQQVLLIHLIIVAVALVAWRSLSIELFLGKWAPRKIAIVGNRRMINAFIRELNRIPYNGHEVTCVCDKSDEACGIGDDSNFECQRYKDVSVMLASNDWDLLAFDSTTCKFSDEDILRILQLKYLGKSVFDLSILYQNITGKVPLFHVDGRWILSREGLHGRSSVSYIHLKRVFDIALASVGILLALPIMIIVAILILLESKGPILYRQERLGMAKKPFICLKFRTMMQDAEKQNGPVYSQQEDPRVTILCRFLRKSRLDELPQLFNILKGEMSFVGPRPIREHFAIKMAEKVPFYWLRYDVKPGVTGWAQSNGVYAVPDGLEAFQYELFYIQNMSILFDLIILLKTAKIMIWGKGK